MGGYRISELAERTGFPASTLRFYEQEGLLPATARTPGGYRSYDEQAVQRLGFIARAKQLGLPLEEIRELAAVWDAGACAPVQQRLAELLTGKISDADAQIVELRAFRAQLVAAHDGLGRYTPDGACDCGCGCVSQPDDPGSAHAAQPVPGSAHAAQPVPGGTHAAQPIRLAMSRAAVVVPVDTFATDGGEAVGCTLPGADQQGRVDQWTQLLGSVTGRESTGDGVRLVLPADPELVGQVARMAALEQQCCRFFDFTIDLSADTVTLTVRAPGHARDLLDTLFGEQR